MKPTTAPTIAVASYPRTWLFVGDSLNAWYNAQVAAGQTLAQLNAYLSQFDRWDRYDYDGDGQFNEPDGYIDHFQSVHAGEGEETGGGAQELYDVGSYGSTGVAADGLGTKPTHMSAYEKIVLCWSNYEVVGAGQHSSVKLGPASTNTKQAQQLTSATTVSRAAAAGWCYRWMHIPTC